MLISWLVGSVMQKGELLKLASVLGDERRTTRVGEKNARLGSDIEEELTVVLPSVPSSCIGFHLFPFVKPSTEMGWR